MNMINIQGILIINIAGIMILVISLLSRITVDKKKHLNDHLFNIMIGITLGALISETLTFVLDGKPGAIVHGLQYLLNAYLFLASCGVGTLWVLYVDYRIYHSRKRIYKWLIPVIIPLVVLALLILCDLFGSGFIFSITEQNVYLRGKLAMLPYVILFSEYFISIILAFIASKQNNHVRFFPILSFILFCVVGTIVQGFNYGLSVGWFCVSLAFLLVQVQQNNYDAFIDDLSGLYNRKYYNYTIRKLSGSKQHPTIFGIMMDVNDFKGINDQFGHTTGDDAIKTIGMLILEVTTNRDLAFRYAGDEFIIIGTFGDERYMEQLIHDLTRKVNEFNAVSGKPYKLSLAIGSTLYQTADLDSDSFLRQIDIKMYESKNRYYSQSGTDRRQRKKVNNVKT